MQLARVLAASLMLVAAAPLPALAKDKAKPKPVELVQAGDNEMSCDALSAEMNTLSTQQAKAAKRAESGRKFLGFAATALQAASPLLSGGGGGGQSGYIAQQALGAVQAQAMQQQMQQQMMGQMSQMGQLYGGGLADQAAPAKTDSSVEAQRLARLTDMHAQKGC
ncbi:MAG: hypothetical protein AB1942_06725 [Pseudomonadota bacterium]